MSLYPCVAPCAEDECAEEGDVSVLPRVFPRGVAGLLEVEDGFPAVSSVDGCGWERNLPRLGAADMVAMLKVESLGLDQVGSCWFVASCKSRVVARHTPRTL